MYISKNGENFIKSMEGLKRKAYLCPAGQKTVGYGHTSKDISMNKIYSIEECDNFFKNDIERFCLALNRLIEIKLNQNQYDALVSFMFNFGVKAFQDSTLLIKLNAGESPDIVAKNEMIRWIFIKHVENKGLKKRREMEISLFTKPIKKDEKI